jgi:NADP-dependent aldehyde dehydrogenase
MVRSVGPRSGAEFGSGFPDADGAAVSEAVATAVSAADAMARLDPAIIAAGLLAAVDGLDSEADALAALADAETALGLPRLLGEVARTSGQLRSFAELVRTGRQLDVVTSRLGPGAPARDLRRMNVPVGVVAVFAASNFPFAFSVAGGDTASALAAGCAVIVKAHYSHPQTSRRVGEVLDRALSSAGLPAHVVQVLNGGVETGRALVCHSDVAAVGFTGSTPGGRALSDLAAQRPVPIPVYAEQGSLNPVVIAPSALADVAAEARLLAGSISAGGGQFCTKPGLIFVPEDRGHRFVAELTAALARTRPQHLLTRKIHDQFTRVRAAAAARPGIQVWQGETPRDGFGAAPTVLVIDAVTFAAEPALHEEMFGPATVVVEVRDVAELHTVLDTVGGNLTATLHGDVTDAWVSVALRSLRRPARLRRGAHRCRGRPGHAARRAVSREQFGAAHVGRHRGGPPIPAAAGVSGLPGGAAAACAAQRPVNVMPAPACFVAAAAPRASRGCRRPAAA